MPRSQVPRRPCFLCSAPPSPSTPTTLLRPASPPPARRPVATKVRRNSLAPLWSTRPSSRGASRSPCAAHAAAPPLVMPAFVPGWDAFLCRCHRRRRREHAHAPPFSFLTPHHPHLADVCHAAVVLRSAAPPACSTPFRTRTSACHPHKHDDTTAATPRSPCARTQSHSVAGAVLAPRVATAGGSRSRRPRGKSPGFGHCCVPRTHPQPAKAAGRRLAPSPATLTAPPPSSVAAAPCIAAGRPSLAEAVPDWGQDRALPLLVHFPVTCWPGRARLAACEPLPRRRPSRAFHRAPSARRRKTPGVLVRTRGRTRTRDRRGSEGIPCAQPTTAKPHGRRTASRRRDPPQDPLRAAPRGRRVAGHTGRRWLKAAGVAATSAVIAGLPLA
jgi:hypothetical protein